MLIYPKRGAFLHADLQLAEKKEQVSNETPRLINQLYWIGFLQE